MKVFASTHEFDYTWEECSIANWRKYCPWNKESNHVIAVDTLSRQFDKDSGVLRTERLITCKQAAPKWVKSFLGGADTSHIYEISYITAPGGEATEKNAVNSSEQQEKEMHKTPTPSESETSLHSSLSKVSSVESTAANTQQPSPSNPKSKSIKSTIVSSASSLVPRSFWRNPSSQTSQSQGRSQQKEQKITNQPEQTSLSAQTDPHASNPDQSTIIDPSTSPATQKSIASPLKPLNPNSPLHNSNSNNPIHPSSALLPQPPSHPSPRHPSITMISQNLTWTDLLSVIETVSYTPSPSSPSDKTRFEQNAKIVAMCGGWQKVKERIEGFTVQRFADNAKRGRRGFEEVLEKGRAEAES